MSCTESELAAKSNVALSKKGVLVPWAEQRVVESQTGRTYRIYVAIPPGEAPADGYPVIYLLDANSVFATMVEAVRIQSRRSDKTGVVPAVVVGIGYETDEPFSASRHYDFTMPIATDELPAKPDGGEWPAHGGAESFIRFIEEEVKPMIERDVPINRTRQTLFGHSLGGLFVLHALFAKPDSFQTYIAGSPSLHWNKRQIACAEQQFSERIKKTPLPIELMIAVGELEGTHPSGMVENAGRLAERLGSLAAFGVTCDFRVFAEEGHVSLLPMLISKALRFALDNNTVRN